MKMTEVDEKVLIERVKAVDTPQRRAFYKANGKTHTEYAWAVFWHIEKGWSKHLYTYLNDAHIQTALLKHVSKP